VRVECERIDDRVDGIHEYDNRILDALAGHGLMPSSSTPPERVRDAVRDLYKYEIRRLRSELLEGRFAKRDYAGRVAALRDRYWVLSIPLPRWTRVPPREKQ
jgi:hypothetical protein